METYCIDKRDKKILSIFSNNARLSYNQIAKKTKISKDSVRNRILKMEKNGIIKSYFTLFDYSKLGITSFVVYCKLKVKNNLDQKLMDQLKKNQNITSITWLFGEYDLRLNIITAQQKNPINILRKNKFLEKLEDYKVLIYESPIIYNTSINGEKSILPIKNKISLKDLDKLDLKIIDLISNNARFKFHELSEKLNMDVDKLRYRIKNLIQCGIITSFQVRTGKSSVGISRYLSLVSMKNKLKNSEKNSLFKIKNIFYLREYKDNQNFVYELRFHTSSNEQLVETVYSLREIFSKNYSNLNINTIFEIIKFDTSPRILLKD